ncbi:MAG TPA: nucleoside recognition domain-containing protein [Phycisphaerae bacterium]|nr:nucleoside recognition domain-containing protein [Phycisphaerae bacterium]HRY68764.1 nucleoside recognition domain-containing protein [Phycisphaerae bacterium]HSA28913.1 nucleoside recognition domain-containing protein [Phycisphaerae bacterium]
MLNKIWFALLLIGLLYGLGKALFAPLARIVPATTAPAAGASAAEPSPSRAEAMREMGKKLTTSAVDAAKASVDICISFIAIMALWLGFMKIAHEAGLIEGLARLLRPLLRWLFPDIPKDHPAGGAIVMNMAANMLGLDNAATPLGLKAMKELQTLNPTQDTATNSMATFLAMNTGSLTLVPFSIIGYRIATGSKDPASPVVAMMIAGFCTTVAAIFAARFLQRFYPMPAAAERVHPASPADAPPDRSEPATEGKGDEEVKS